ncbi:efflux transporter, RND family, MFP subunit [Thermocrinis albus DSM 14484]|uniref:Efflux transporter, RND family, MFP subunit n=1 Tax=Thermocrinis albus (strain DSM 14484 / JCM 11386 / HI 11/12) TaxID=638303 RepID=D3SQH2_THEAH|nr:efflux RND transporter periplasmic adaptor subunit [Thermocrinis albus]ADC89409.1 efflux transporter, RND family, MFP subunit [Thermocrinis albus DSM 14484]
MFWLLLLPVIVLAQVIKVDPSVEKQLGITTQVVKITEEDVYINAPARVSEYTPTVAQVFSPAEGVVRKLLVKEGDKVKKGQVLAYIYSQRVADLLAQLRMAQVRLRTAQDTLKREEMLYREEVIPYARYFAAKVEYERALGEVKALQRALASMGEVSNDMLVVRAPISGVVVHQGVVLGSYTGVQSEMFRIQSQEKLWAYLYLPPYQVDKVKVGQKGFLLWSGKKIWGTVDYVSRVVDTNTKTVPVRLLLDNREGLLRPGIMTEGGLLMGKVKGVWLPASAVQKVNKMDVVFVKTSKGFEVYPVKKIMESKDKVLVEGLREGMQVAVSGVIFLKTRAEQ